MKCDRCSKKVNTLRMSIFNTEMCCTDCLDKEERHPLYKIARDKEHEEVVSGNYNYPGMGLPDDLRINN